MSRPKDDIRQVLDRDLRDIAYNIAFHVLRPLPHPDAKPLEDSVLRMFKPNFEGSGGFWDKKHRQRIRSNFFRGAFLNYSSQFTYENDSLAGEPNLAYMGYVPGAKAPYGKVASLSGIQVTNLRINKITKVIPGDLDAVDVGGDMVTSILADVDNPTDVPVGKTISSSVTKGKTQSLQLGAKVSAAYEYSLSQTVKTPVAEATSTEKVSLGLDSWVDRITTHTSSSTDSDATSYTVPPHCHFALVQKRSIKDLHQSFWVTGELQATVRAWSRTGFDWTFNRFDDIEDMLRGLRGGEYDYAGRWWSEHALSDEDAFRVIQRPTRTIDVPVVASDAKSSSVQVAITPYPGYSHKLAEGLIGNLNNALRGQGIPVEEPDVKPEKHRDPDASTGPYTGPVAGPQGGANG